MRLQHWAAGQLGATRRSTCVGTFLQALTLSFIVCMQVTDDQLKAIFNSALMAAFPGSSIPGMEPVVGIVHQADKPFAFIEFRVPEMATAALQLSGQVRCLLLAKLCASLMWVAKGCKICNARHDIVCVGPLSSAGHAAWQGHDRAAAAGLRGPSTVSTGSTGTTVVPRSNDT